MKNFLLLLVLTVFSFSGFSQTAVNFHCNDCSGVTHDLFSECDAGNVIVLCWVMPCGSCVSGALTCSNICQTYPSNVKFYIADDYANTNCTSLNSWVVSNGISNATLFSDASINMLDYGTTGMPKCVIIAGSSHTVFYNADFTFDPAAIQNSINQALTVASIRDVPANITSFSILPNPVMNEAAIKYTILHSSLVQVELFDLQGKRLQDVYTGIANAGENTVTLNTTQLASGMYLVKMTEGTHTQFANVVVAR